MKERVWDGKKGGFNDVKRMSLDRVWGIEGGKGNEEERIMD